MKRYFLLGFGLLFIFVVSAIVHVPAQVLVDNVPLPEPLKLSGVEGRVWQGSASNVSWQNESFGRLQWTLLPSKLLSGKAEAQIRFGQGSEMQLTGRGVVGYGLDGTLYAENLMASLPVSQVIKMAPPMPIPLTLSGNIELTVKRLDYATPYCRAGEGTLVWNTDKIGTPLDELVVGPVVADVTCSDSVISLNGGQKSAQVESEAEVVLQPNRRYQSKAWFKPASEFPKAFSEQLAWLPDPDSEGRYQFTYNGRL